MSDHVIRYGLTFVERNGDRILFDAAQGRYFPATAEEAQARCDAIKGNPGSMRKLAEIHGPQFADSFRVDPIKCWPGHFDPKGIYVQ